MVRFFMKHSLSPTTHLTLLAKNKNKHLSQQTVFMLNVNPVLKSDVTHCS